MHDFGAGDLLELTADGGRIVTVPFTREAVPEVDLSAGRVVIVPPEELMAEPETAGESAA